MGDILQTSPLITYMKEKFPDSQIGCMTASSFQDVMTGIPGIDFYHPLELMDYMLPLKENKILPNLRIFEQLVEELSGYNYDTIFNLTHNRLGSTLSWLLPGETIGMTLNDEGFALVENPWMRQFYNTNINRGLNQFNLVDLYRLSVGFKPEDATDMNSRLRFNVPDEARKWADETLKSEGCNSGKKIVGIQAGASAESKSWNYKYLNQTAKMLASDFITLFFGSKKEIELVDRASEGVPGAINFAGRTDIKQLAALLEKCDTLISNDTGTMHLSAAVGTKVIALTMGPALASETAPFGKNHIIIEPEIECGPCNYRHPCLDFTCHALIKPELVDRVARIIIEGGDISGIDKKLTGTVKISRTSFDEFGLWKLSRVDGRKLTLQERVNIAYRKTWYQLLSNNNIKDLTKLELSGKVIALIPSEYIDTIDKLSEIAASGADLTLELKKECREKKLSIERIKIIGEKIAGIDRKISSIGEENTLLRPLTLDFNLGKESLPDSDLQSLAEKTHSLYDRLKNASLLFKKHLIIPEPKAKPENSPAVIGNSESPRVLAINPPYFAAGEIIRAFIRKGVNIKICDLNPDETKKGEGIKKFIDALLKKADSFKPDFLVTVNHLGFDDEGFVVSELEKRGIPSAILYVDSPMFIMNKPEKLISDLSVIFCWDRYYVDRLRKNGFNNVEYMPLASDTTIFRPRNKVPDKFRLPLTYVAASLVKAIEGHLEGLEPPMIDESVEIKIDEQLSMNGKIFPDIIEKISEDFKFRSKEQRRRFLAGWTMKIYQRERLKTIEKLNRLNLTIYGDEDWNRMFRDAKPDLRGIITYSDQLPKVYAGSEISFNMTSYQMPNGLNQRVFDVPASGGFLLTDYRPVLEEIFDLKQDVAVYHDPDEAEELAEYYLKNPGIREKMSKRALEKIVNSHTYDHRVDTILKRMSQFSDISVARVEAFSKTITPGHAAEEENVPVQTKEKERIRHSSSESSVVPSANPYSHEHELTPDLITLKNDLKDKIDVPREISVHGFGNRMLVISPERAAWIVTDRIGTALVNRLAVGETLGETAAFVASNYNMTGEEILRKLREIIELMNVQNFRESRDSGFDDIDRNPRNLQLFLSRSCNLNCTHCYFSAGEPMDSELSTEEWKSIIGKFAYMGQGSIVTFTGGEPLLHSDFFEIAGEAVNNGLKVILLTNGQLIDNREIARKIADIVETVQISIDGASAEFNDSIRGAGSFQGAVNAAKFLLTEKVEVEFTCVVLPENVENLAKNLKNFIESFNSSRLRCALTVANPIGRLKEGYLESGESLVGRVITACGENRWLRAGGFQSGRINFGCELAKSIVVNPEGKIGNCPYLNYSGPKNIRDGEFAKFAVEDCAWHRNAMQKSKKCLDCDLRNFQCGGCKIFGKCTDQLKLRSYYRMLEGK